MSVYVDIEKTVGSFKLKACFSAENETLALLGASGCGKSMTLKCIAGIEKPDRGRIVVDDVVLFDSDRHIDLTPQERNVGLMFQSYALFPNMTVMQNIMAGAKREKDKAKREKVVNRVIESFGLTELVSHYPHQLSGGQQQRVALARMLVSTPRILLLDEPFSALDSHLRFNMEQEVREVIREFGKTVILVSHDRDEVFRMADSIAVMDSGCIEVCGSKHDVFKNPLTRSAAVLTGCKNISRIKKMENGNVFALDWGIELNTGYGFADAEYVGIRMHSIQTGIGENHFRCKVIETIENTFSFTVMLSPINGMGRIGWELDKETWLSMRADELDVYFPPESIMPLK